MTMTGAQWLGIGLLPLAAYLMGSIPFGLLVGRAVAGVDIRRQGSGNIGATNVRRAVGTLPAVVVLMGDAAKGFLPVWWAGLLISSGPSPWLQGYIALVALCAFAGHLYPIFLRFRTGGKGVATAVGCLLALSPGALGISGLVFIMTACGLNRVSAASLAATAVMPLAVSYATGSAAFTIWAALTGVWVWIRHRDNIRRLLACAEPPIWKPNSK